MTMNVRTQAGADTTDRKHPAEAFPEIRAGVRAVYRYDVERKFRQTRLYQIAPISTNLILSYVGEHVLGMPRSY